MGSLSQEAGRHMRALTNGLPTKSAKIRALADAGYKRQEIADFLGIRYQHVRNVLLQPLAQRSDSTPSNRPGVEDSQVSAFAADVAEGSGNFLVETDGRVLLPAALRKLFDWQPGRRVFWLREQDTLRLFSQEAALQFAQTLVARHASSANNVVEEFLKERREDAQREDRG